MLAEQTDVVGHIGSIVKNVDVSDLGGHISTGLDIDLAHLVSNDLHCPYDNSLPCDLVYNTHMNYVNHSSWNTTKLPIIISLLFPVFLTQSTIT